MRGWFRRKEKPYEAEAASLYAALVAQAREPAFYREGGVPDSLDGRFEMILLHAFALFHRLKAEPAGSDGAESAQALGQRLFDLLFLDMDRSLREMGVGDLGVGKRIKAMTQAFYGRIAAYEAALATGPEALEQALARNLYGTTEAGPAQLSAVAGYLGAAAGLLAHQPIGAILGGEVHFPPPPAFPESGEAAEKPRAQSD